MSESYKKYGDWRDDVLESGIVLHAENSRFAEPYCPEHGLAHIRKKKINKWVCLKCDFEMIIAEEIYRAWLKQSVESGTTRIPPLSQSPRAEATPSARGMTEDDGCR